MKNIFLLFALLLCTCVRAQTQITTSDSIDYYLVTTETEDNGTDTDNTITKTTHLGDTSNLANAILMQGYQQHRKYLRLLANLQRLNYVERFSELSAAASTVGIDMDSLEATVYASGLIGDTMDLVLITRLLPADFVAGFLPSGETNIPARITARVFFFAAPNGRIRIRRAGVAGSWPAQPRTAAMIQFPLFPYDAYQESDNERRTIWRSLNLGRPAYRIVRRKPRQ